MHHIASDWRRADLQKADRALCAYAVKLTKSPTSVCEEDIVALRQHGLDDRAIPDATQVIGYFNYINRVAEGLHVEQEDFIRPWEKSSYVGDEY